MPAHPIPVICDRCRAEGHSDEDPFAAFGTLLDFDPVPRRSKRADGWTPDVQRAFVAALSLTGSVRAACRAVDKAQFGFNQLLSNPGSESFRAACEEAMEIAADERGRRLAEGLRAVAEEQAGWRPPDPPWAKAAKRGRPPGRTAAASPPAGPEDAATELREIAKQLLRRYVIKVDQERRCRLAGRIVAADFYLRQLSWFEAAADLVSGDVFKLLQEFRAGEHHLIDIAETPASRLLDQARRSVWAEQADPLRPEPPSRDLLHDHGRFSTEPLESFRGAAPLSDKEQRRAYEERHRRDAEAQVAWEAQALRDHDERLARDAAAAAAARAAGAAREGDEGREG